MKIVLFGYMGSGKSTIGKHLAKVLEVEFLDLDLLIEQNEKASITEIFSDKGEIYFRKKEAEILKEILLSKDKYVLAVGGGTPCYGDSLQFINGADEIISIYLKCSLEILTERLFSEKNIRPLIAHLESKKDLNDFIRKHLFERSYYYNQAKLTIECNAKSVSEVVEYIIASLF